MKTSLGGLKPLAVWGLLREARTALDEAARSSSSKPLLRYLFEHTVRPEFTCRFRWQPGSLALWDNRCAMHNPINDYHGFTRAMHRITLAGDVPR